MIRWPSSHFLEFADHDLFNEHHSIKSYNKAVRYGESQKILCSIGAKFEAEVVTEP